MKSATTLRVSPLFGPLALSVTVFGLAIGFSFTSLLHTYPELAVGAAYDLAISAPFFYYLAIRKTRIPKISVAAVFSLGLLTATYFLPSSAQTHIGFLLKFLLPAVEITVMSLIGYKTYRTFKAYKKERLKTNDLRILLQEVCEEVLGNSLLSKAVAFEASIFAYAFLPVRKMESPGRSFSYHRFRRTNPVYGIIAFIIVSETIVLHLVVAKWSVPIAWILTCSSIYILMLLLAQFRAIRKRPIEILADAVVVRCGLFSNAVIPFDDIESVEPTSIVAYNDPGIYHAALFKSFEDLNLLMTLKRENTATGPYWIKKSFRRIAFFVDQKDEFVDLVSKHDPH